MSIALLSVSAAETSFPEARLTAGPSVFAAVLGRGGIRIDKREGDGATPVGRFPLRRVLYRADRTAVPVTCLPVQAIARDDGWCDDPADSAYNRPVRLPYRASAETLWREDGVYDIVVILGHNDDPVVPGAGSAIFMHLVRPERTATEGCVALAEADLRAILALAGPDTVIEIQAG